jgi:transcriptional regulator with XRE-family HTH domain
MPMADTLRSELGRYLIGHKLRALRLRRSMGLAQLSERTGLSAALLSKIENARLVPTLPTLMRVAMVFDVSLDHFFQSDFRHRVVSITRKEEQASSFSVNRAEIDSYSLTRLDLGFGDRKFQPYLAQFFPKTAASGKPHTHQGVEFIHVLRGALQILVGADAHILHVGDSIYFDSGLRHAYERLGDDECIGFMVFAYPEKNLAERRIDRLEGVHGVRRQFQTTAARSESLQNSCASGLTEQKEHQQAAYPEQPGI